MTIVIKKDLKTRFAFWLPSGPTVVSLFLKFLVIDGEKVNKVMRRKIVSVYKVLRKHHKPVALIEIESATGDHLLIKI
jgi:hypothetical protein